MPFLLYTSIFESLANICQVPLHSTTSMGLHGAGPVVTLYRRLWMNSHAFERSSRAGLRQASTKQHTMFTGSLPIDKRLERYTPYEFTADLSHLGKGDQAAIKPLVQAAKLIDKIYFRQAWSGNEQLRKKLEELGDKKLVTLFNMYKGPWVSSPDVGRTAVMCRLFNHL